MAEKILTHGHAVIDSDIPFRIDPLTKTVIPGSSNLTLAQRSQDSERFTFTIPGTVIEGHDMTRCNAVMIHFQNIDQSGTSASIGIYKVDDLDVHDDSVTLSWLVGLESTIYAGGLIFSIHFMCVEDGVVVYDFPTLTYSGITVGATVWNSETIVKEYPDIIAEFEARIAALERGGSMLPDDILRYSPQELTLEQQAQVQKNIGLSQDLTNIDLSNLLNGTWTETINGEVINHTSVFSADGTTVTIDGVVVKLR